MNLVPRKVFFVSGVGRHKEKLRSFEEALRDAGIAEYNIVCVSSILPPNCKIISKKEGYKYLKSGQILFCVLARNSTSEANRLVATSIGCAVPKDRSNHGYLSEHHSFGENEKIAGDYAEDLAACMLASTLGVEFDVDKDWNEKEEIFKMSGKIVKTRNITKTASGKVGLWTTVVSAAVLILEE